MEPKVEELKIKLHSNVHPKTTYHLDTLEQNFKNKRIKLYRCSMDLNKRIKMTRHPVLTAYYTAFLEHYPAILSPDILWMLILEGFSRHVKLNSEKLKHKFIKSNSDKIVVKQDPKGDKSINKTSSQRWGDIFKDFVESSKEYIDSTILHLFTPYFSTTTEEIEYSCQLNIMSIISPYVTFIKKYGGCCCGGCAFPYIKLLGTLQDFKQLRIKTEGLKGFLIDDWIDKILNIIDKIIETKKGKIDYKFWDNMITNQKREYTDELEKKVSDAHEAKKYEKIEIFGWIFDFFPFKEVTYSKEITKEELLKIKSYNPDLYNKYLQHASKYLSEKEYDLLVSNDEEINDHIFNRILKKRGIINGEYDSLFRNDVEVYEDSNFYILPEEMIELDATYRNSKGQTAELGIKTGFIGYSLDDVHAFKPEIGWYFYIKNDPYNLIKSVKFN